LNSQVISELILVPKDVRMARIDELVNSYIEKTGLRPSGEVLEKLTNAVLHEELTNKSSAKVSKYEYPIMSDRQLARRRTGSERHRRKDGIIVREVPYEHASNVSVEGRDYTRPIRSFKNPYM
jgi:hypothetical protein